MLYSKAESKEFFNTLRAASIDTLQYFGLPFDVGGKTRPWKEKHPIGVIEHYTAGVAWRGTIKYLCEDSPDSSCHLLILDRRIAEVDDIWSKAGLDLPVTCFLLADLKESTWHATWANAYCFGIENRNAGYLMGKQEDWKWWPKKFTTPFPHKELGKTPIRISGSWWEPYTYGQIVANVIICQHLYCLYEGQLDRRWFLPHHCIDCGKLDTGNAFPLDDIRTAVFEQTPVENLLWLHNFKADPMYMDDYDKKEDLEFLQELVELHGIRSDSEDLNSGELESVPELNLQLLVEDGKWVNELPTIRWALRKLGYYVPASDIRKLDEDTALAVWMFQKSMNLKTDKIPGPVTQKYLHTRLRQFGLA